jgi:hypothetical protein
MVFSFGVRLPDLDHGIANRNIISVEHSADQPHPLALCV